MNVNNEYIHIPHYVDTGLELPSCSLHIRKAQVKISKNVPPITTPFSTFRKFSDKKHYPFFLISRTCDRRVGVPGQMNTPTYHVSGNMLRDR